MGFSVEELIQVQFTIENENQLHATCKSGGFCFLVYELSENKCYQ